MKISADPAPGEGPILEELAAIGFSVQSLAELRSSGKRYRNAIPILIEWLGRVSNPKAKEEVVRALSVPWAKPEATRALIKEFRETEFDADPTGFGLRWTIGNALEVVFDDIDFDPIAELVLDKRYGVSRQMIVLGLAKSRKPGAVEVLLSLIDDSEVDGHALKALRKIGTPAARSAFESKFDDSRAWVRSEARKGLERLAD